MELKKSYLEFTGDVNDLQFLMTYHLRFLENTTKMIAALDSLESDGVYVHMTGL